MLKPVRDGSDDTTPRLHRRRRRLRTVAMLPTLLTLGNLYFGFAATYYCAREMQELGAGHDASEVDTLKSAFFEARAPSYLSIACWMLMAAMICDALDGRVARKTGQSSKFGEQLDSLADVVSFGVAPALMMVTLVHRELDQMGYVPFGADRFGRIAVFIGAIYVCCTGLRLARFTVEASFDEAAHQGFRGLPSPGAAGAVVSLIFLHDHLDAAPARWVMTADLIARTLPLWTLAAALLMVSRVPYVHLVSVFLRRRPFGHVIPVLLLVPLLVLHTELALVIIAWVFVGSGLAGVVGARFRAVPAPANPDTKVDAAHEPTATQTRQQAP